ncbi:MAG: dihydroxyacetone kinase subunit DhaK [Rhodospirillales bacterium 20-64-7]|nr:MAG: dihydroxyacetone kinase subunit DhaK [Rhodospirillales bacterium 20-64-7]HQT76667.1 dihydroxyacetone kinase family protein [Rhodopila sp.]
MKKLINDPRHVVRQMLEGVVALSPGLALLKTENVVLRADVPPPAQRPVAVVSGGGAGHEPAHAGYVGAGMLHAAVVGDVFTSPSVDAVLAAIRAVGGPAGVVLVVKNYTGDRLNFGLAAELAINEGIPCEIVVVADDVALHGTVEPARRRGIAGTVLVHKVAGAAAASGAPLQQVADRARKVAAAIGTMGAALGPCTVPAAGRPGFDLGEDEIELGLGIHGEAGVRRERLEPADRLVEAMLDVILADRCITANDRVALLVNGLGGTPPMELAIVARHALTTLRSRGLTVSRAWCGNLLTALEMPGCSLSVLPVDDALLRDLDLPTDAPAWPGSGLIPARLQLRPAPVGTAASAGPATGSGHGNAPRVRDAILACANALEAAHTRLTELDSAAGDGDLGASMARGAAALRAVPAEQWGDAPAALALAGDTLRRAIAGSSGPFYAVALLHAARRLAEPDGTKPLGWAAAFSDAVNAIAGLGGATPGDRTMLDALRPAADAFQAALEAGQDLGAAWQACVHAGADGAARTAMMLPRLGRASYLGERALGTPDAGAAAVQIWLEALTPFIG